MGERDIRELTPGTRVAVSPKTSPADVDKAFAELREVLRTEWTPELDAEITSRLATIQASHNTRGATSVAKDVIHYGKTRSWWDGSATTLCGLKFPKVKAAGWFQDVNCPTCKRIRKGK